MYIYSFVILFVYLLVTMIRTQIDFINWKFAKFHWFRGIHQICFWPIEQLSVEHCSNQLLFSWNCWFLVTKHSKPPLKSEFLLGFYKIFQLTIDWMLPSATQQTNRTTTSIVLLLNFSQNNEKRVIEINSITDCVLVKRVIHHAK